MNETEAKQKRCLLVELIATVRNPAETEPKKCLGSDCGMFWRWESAQDGPSTTRGHCGLGGPAWDVE